jgi:phosphatidylserine decarboxylase
MSLIEENPTVGILLVASTSLAIVADVKWLIAINVIVLIMFLYFYRKPSIVRKEFAVGTIYGPCYGKVSNIVYDKESDTNYITIFLSPLDIHHQYYPVSGTLIERIYDQNGNFALAYEFEKSSKNEKAIHRFNVDNQIITMIQIAGFLARRITYDGKLAGSQVFVGDRLGMIHFGSRVDLILPASYKLQIQPHSYINGPDTIIAKL